METRPNNSDKLAEFKPEGFSLRDKLLACGYDEFNAYKLTDMIQVISVSSNARHLNTLERSLNVYFETLRNNDISLEMRIATDGLLEESAGAQGLIAARIRMGNDGAIDLTSEEIFWSNPETYRAFIDASKKARQVGDKKSFNSINKSLVANFDRVAQIAGWDDKHVLLQKKMLGALIGVDVDEYTVEDSEITPRQTVQEEVKVAENKSSIKDRFKNRLRKIKTAVLNPWDINNWKEALGDKDGKHSRRNVIIGLSIGAGAVALALWLNNKGGGVEVASSESVPDVPVPSGSSTTTINSSSSSIAPPIDVPAGGIDLTPPVVDVPTADIVPSPTDFGLDLQTDLPWSVVDKLSSGDQIDSLRSAMSEYSQQTGLDVSFVGSGQNTMIQVGDRIANNSDISSINEILFNQLT